MPVTNRRIVSKAVDRMPYAWLRCDMCFGTGYVFLPSRAGIKSKLDGIATTMTNKLCETCLGNGYVLYPDDFEV